MGNRDLQREYYDRVYQTGRPLCPEERPSAGIKDYFVNRFLDMTITSSEQRVLEIGCGDGTLTGYLLDRGLNVHALDISPVAIAHLRDRFSPFVASGRLIAHSDDVVDYLKASGQRFDVIMGAGIIHHIEKDRRVDFFTAVHRALRDGGTFACAPEPNADGLYFYLWQLAGWAYKKLYHMDYDLEVEKGTLDMQSEPLLRDLRQAGFSRAEILPYQTLPHFSSRLISLIDRKLVSARRGRWALYTTIRAMKA